MSLAAPAPYLTVDPLDAATYARVSGRPVAECEAILRLAPCHAVMAGDRAVIIGGIIPVWEGRAVAWTLLGDDPTAREIALALPLVAAVLDRANVARIEGYVRAHDGRALLLAQRLGFALECRVPLWRDGIDWLQLVRLCGASHG